MSEHHHEHNASCDHLHNHGGNLNDLMASIPTEQQFFMAADVFSMLCDSTRLRILWLLCHTEECVSDIFANLFIAVEDGYAKDIKKLAGTIAKRRAIDYFRKLSASGKNTVSVDDESLPELKDCFDVENISENKEVRNILLREINSLGEPDSTIILQKFYYNKSSSEIAKTVRMTASSVRSRCTRAMERLRISLSAMGITR